MALKQSWPVRPRFPDWPHLDPRRLQVDYDRESDLLVVALFGLGRPATVLQTGGLIDYLLDPESDEVVGFQIDGYLSRAIDADPLLLDFADAAAIPAEEIQVIRARITPARRLLAAASALIPG